MSKKTDDTYLWWHTGIIYQIYPRSFQDSDGDGVGDIKGIIKRLDYLKWLGINAIWLSPIFPSPMADFGYDISDYQNIHPLFGTLDEFDELLKEVHRRDMKLLLDFVPNHTSDQHPWFRESRSSRDNPKRDWYIWRDPGQEMSFPNNWLSVFGGTAWKWDQNTRQYYYHGFLKEQPDLNWRNPEVQNAMYDAMRFWLDKGVDGFRVDVIWHMIKDSEFRDNPENPYYDPNSATYNKLNPEYSTDQPEVHGIVRKMREILDSYGERLLIGEIYLPVEKLMQYYGENGDEAHLPFNFQLISMQWNPEVILNAISSYENALPENGWPNWVLGNHDQSRIASRVGAAQARNAAILLLTLRGTPTVYYGDEIGLTNVQIPKEEIRDPQGLNMPDKNLSRDPFRTPMQWDSSQNAGFTEGKPWLRLHPDYQKMNVEREKEDEDSMLSLYQKLIRLRQMEPSLMFGEFTPLYADRQVLAYSRKAEGYPGFLIVLNLTDQACVFPLPDHNATGSVLISSLRTSVSQVKDELWLSENEGMVIKLD